jgi:hypothetical protein
LRREAHVKGSLDHRGGTRGKPPSNEMPDAASKLLLMLNGDWKSQRLVHHCFACDVCRGDIATTREHVFAALLACDVLSVRCIRTPSQKDWGSCSEHCSKQCLGILCHGVLPQAMVVAFPDWAGMQPPVDPAVRAMDGPGDSHSQYRLPHHQTPFSRASQHQASMLHRVNSVEGQVLTVRFLVDSSGSFCLEPYHNIQMHRVSGAQGITVLLSWGSN